MILLQLQTGLTYAPELPQGVWWTSKALSCLSRKPLEVRLPPETEVGNPAGPTGLMGLGVYQPYRTVISTLEPQVSLTVEGKEINFLPDAGVTFSVLLSNPGKLSSETVAFTRISGKPIKIFSQPLR